MNEFKKYILSVIITSVVLQVSNLLLSNTKLVKFYTSIASIIIISVLFSPILSLPEFLFREIPTATHTDFSDSTAESVFCRNLEKKINDDIAVNGYDECFVTVTTDWDTLKIIIHCTSENSNTDNVEKFIKEKYCTPEDEVSVSIYE